MSIWRYRYFVDVIDTKSFTKAGKKNYVSQTAISQQIAQFEKSIGGKLIHRGKGEVTPTALGEVVYARAKEILEIDEKMLDEIRELQSMTVLRVGIDNTIRRTVWVEMQKLIDTYYEEEDFQFSKLDYYTGSSMLEKGDLDIYIGYDLNFANESGVVEAYDLAKSRMGVYMSDQNGIADGKEVTIAELEAFPGYMTDQYPCSVQLFKNHHASKEIKALAEKMEHMGNIETLSIKVEINNGFTFADSRFFGHYAGKMHVLSDAEETCDLKLFCRTDITEKEEFLKTFIGRVQSVIH